MKRPMDGIIWVTPIPSAPSSAPRRELQTLISEFKFAVPIGGLEFREAERGVLAAENAAIEAVGLGDDPVTAAVLADDKMEGIGALGRFFFSIRLSESFAHATYS